MIVSLPNWRSMRPTQLKLCVCVGRVRSTPPNSTPGQAGLLLRKVPKGVGLPDEIAYGPKDFRACRLWLPGKQAESVAIPAGVGTLPALVYRLFCEMICWLKPPKRNSLFFTTGPPMVKPPNSSLARGIDVRGLPAASVAKRFWKFVMEFRTVLFSCA